MEIRNNRRVLSYRKPSADATNPGETLLDHYIEFFKATGEWRPQYINMSPEFFRRWVLFTSGHITHAAYLDVLVNLDVNIEGYGFDMIGFEGK